MTSDESPMSTSRMIITAYLGNHDMAPEAVPNFITQVYRAVVAMEVSPPDADLVPVVPIKASVTADWIICLVCGERFKSLKRHIKTHDYSPETYREAFRLPLDYPMTAPNYSEQRRQIANDTRFWEQSE